MTVNASRKRSLVVLSIFRIASLVAAIESTRSLRCVVRNVWRDSRSSNWSIAIMLTAPIRSILARRSATISSGVSGRWRQPARRSTRRSRCRRPCRLSLPRLPPRPARRPPARGWRAAPSRSSCATSARDLVERGLHGFDAGRGEVRRGRLRRSRASTSSWAASARTASSDAPGLADPQLPARRTARAAPATPRRPPAPARAARRTCAGPASSAASADATCRPQLLAAASSLRCRSSAASRRAPRARARPPRAAATSAASALARSTSAACAALASAVRRACACIALARLEQPALRAVQLLVGGALLALDPLDRLPRFVLAGLLRAQLLLRRPALVGDLLLLPRHALRRVARRCRPAARSRRPPSPAGAARPGATDRGLGRRRSTMSSAATSSRSRSTVEALLLGALAQLLDLALGREDAARLGARRRLRRRGRRGTLRPRASRPARGQPRRARPSPPRSLSAIQASAMSGADRRRRRAR